MIYRVHYLVRCSNYHYEEFKGFVDLEFDGPEIPSTYQVEKSAALKSVLRQYLKPEIKGRIIEVEITSVTRP